MSKTSYYTVVGDTVRVYTPYCDKVVKDCRAIGGKFSDRAWILPAARLKDVQEMLGASVDDMVEVEISARDCDGYAQLSYGWFVLAARRSRDSTATAYETLIAGRFPASGGSVKNPAVSPSEDAVFRLAVPRDFAEANGLSIVDNPAAATTE